jgi:acid phosphatase family membrane protein YuiD
MNQLADIVFSPFNKLLIIAGATQVASMITKAIILTIKNKALAFNKMATYGGMPSSHTAFVSSFMFGVALDKNYGWQSPFFVIGLIVTAIVMADALKLRDTIDKLNDILKEVIAKDKELAKKIKFPKHIAHKGIEIVAGLIFSFLFTFIFYLLLYSIYPTIK